MFNKRYILALEGTILSNTAEVCKEILKQAEGYLLLHRLMPVTTRPMKEKDKENPGHFFISREEYDKLLGNNLLYSFADFKTSDNDIYSYGLEKAEVDTNNSNFALNILVSNPVEIKMLKDNLPDYFKLRVINLDISHEELEKQITLAAGRHDIELVDRITRDRNCYFKFRDKTETNYVVTGKSLEEVAVDILYGFATHICYDFASYAVNDMNTMR